MLRLAQEVYAAEMEAKPAAQPSAAAGASAKGEAGAGAAEATYTLAVEKLLQARAELEVRRPGARNAASASVRSRQPSRAADAGYHRAPGDQRARLHRRSAAPQVRALRGCACRAAQRARRADTDASCRTAAPKWRLSSQTWPCARSSSIQRWALRVRGTRSRLRGRETASADRGCVGDASPRVCVAARVRGALAPLLCRVGGAATHCAAASSSGGRRKRASKLPL